MRVSEVKIAGRFKRFGSLEITGLSADVELVVMLGPNGSGKSSVFDAFLQWARQQGRPARRNVSSTYFDSETGAFGQPVIIPHAAADGVHSGGLGSLLHVRTAHRNTPDVVAKTVEKQPDFRQRTTFERMCQRPVGSAQWRTVELPSRGQQNCPVVARCSARWVSWSVASPPCRRWLG